MLVSNPKTFSKMRTVNARGQKSAFTRIEATSSFSRRCQKVENNIVDRLDVELALRRRIRERLEAKGFKIVAL